MRRSLCLAVCLVAVTTGCGSTSRTSLRSHVVALPHSDWFSYEGPLPGRPAAAVTTGFPVAVGSVRVVLTTRSGKERVPLFLARSRTGHLCIGTTGVFRCFTASDVNPVYALTVFAGHRGTVDSGAVVGFERRGVRTTIELQDGKVLTLRARHVPGFPFDAFASRIYHGNGHFPDTLHFFDRAGRRLSGFHDLAFLWQPCPNTPGGCTPTWRVGGDAIATMLGRVAAGPEGDRVRRAQTIALRDSLLRSFLRGHEYSVAPSGMWVKQQGGLIGETFEIHVAPRAAYDADFPVTDCSTTAAYNAGVVHYKVANVSQLDVSVDLNSRRVVSIDPTDTGPDDPDPVFDRGSYRVVEKPHPAGGPDHGSCESGD